jgi:hypothetical protein
MDLYNWKKPRSMLPPCSSNDSTLKAPLNAKVLKQQNIQIGKKKKSKMKQIYDQLQENIITNHCFSY